MTNAESVNETMTPVQERLAWLAAVNENVGQFIESGGVIGSEESGPLIALLFRAIDDMASVTDPRKTSLGEPDICAQG